MYTISKLANEFGLSRSTLLYYDSIGLLKCPKRNNSGYRYYSRKEYNRLEQICMYREMGLPLMEIKKLLSKSCGETMGFLQKHLLDISGKIKEFKKQQLAIVQMLKQNLINDIPTMDKEQWVSLLRTTGLSDDDMHKWHKEFERLSPSGHHDFLASLGIDEKEIKRIRTWAEQSI